MLDDLDDLKAIGRDLVKARSYPGAIKVFSRALELAPDDAFVLDVLGFLHYMTGAFAEARVMCERAIALQPESFYARKGLGLCLVRLGEPEAGIAALRDSIGLKPDYFDSRHDLAVTFVELGRLDEARRELEEAARVDPSWRPRLDPVLRQVAALESKRGEG